uniref:Carbamoyltransferase n=2 Tax=Candidatus Kentrum sp. SD TaxID=2126332 RepID=A0A450Y6X4_9GAMM|nr:MAG: carbamoyltransferase [Candidatus Kentron sp. SD]VFK42310.1 MAG: carbamoyltransferase [Candidatus Kentron sp. SD]
MRRGRDDNWELSMITNQAFLGIGGSGHDFSAALVSKGNLQIAIEEERIDRSKHGSRIWHSHPCNLALNYCLSATNIRLEDVASIYIPQDHVRRESQILGRQVIRIGHHLAHAAASFYPSPFQEAAVLVIDGHGGHIETSSKDTNNLETISIGSASGSSIALNTLQSGIKTVTSTTWHHVVSNSLGSFYKAVSDLIGFGFFGVGKLMGLAAYGDNSLLSEMRKWVDIDVAGKFYFDPYSGFSDWVQHTLRCSRNSAQIRANIAAAVQKIFEETVLRLAKHCQQVTGAKYLSYGGGCALNTVANRRILDETKFKSLYIFPAPGDAGLAVGAAYFGYYIETGAYRFPSELQTLGTQAYCGRKYGEDEMKQALDKYPVLYHRATDTVNTVTKRLLEGEIIGIFRERSEIGPRALGNRSIITLPDSSIRRRFINMRVKNRETFRPFAPVVIFEAMSKFFELEDESPFMLLVAKVRPEWRASLGAITHADETARVQTVRRESNPFLYDLLVTVENHTGIPVLLNTSFNRRNEPIVESPEDALSCFLNQELDTLLLGKYIVEKHTPWACPSEQIVP